MDNTTIMFPDLGGIAAIAGVAIFCEPGSRRWTIFMGVRHKPDRDDASDDHSTSGSWFDAGDGGGDGGGGGD